jgi:hypothetical protein
MSRFDRNLWIAVAVVLLLMLLAILIGAPPQR